MKTMKCNQCGKKLTPVVTWHYEMLQVLWYCGPCKCGYVRDVYFTGTNAPSPFSDANLEVEQAIGDLLEEQIFATAEELPLEGCPTDEEIQIAEDELPLVADVFEGWGEGRGYD